MYACYRVQMKEYDAVRGWVDDGYIYSLDEYLLMEERDRRIRCAAPSPSYDDIVEGGLPEIVAIHESLARDLGRTPVLATVKGTHPADQGVKPSIKREQNLCIQAAVKRQGNTSGLSAAH